jgi:hypothetical protein
MFEKAEFKSNLTHYYRLNITCSQRDEIDNEVQIQKLNHAAYRRQPITNWLGLD